MQKALEMQREAGGLLGEVLVSTGALTEQALAHALASYFGFDVANLRRDNVDPTMINYLPEDVARELMAFPAIRNLTSTGKKKKKANVPHVAGY